MSPDRSDSRLSQTDPWDIVAEAREQRRSILSAWWRPIIRWGIQRPRAALAKPAAAERPAPSRLPAGG
jgi:hypothetical protein